jgi:YaiO family outer membrane protein
MNRNSVWRRHKLFRAIPCCILLLFGSLFYSCPQEAVAEGGAPDFKNRIELSGAYEYLSPHDPYGNWETFIAAFYRKERPDFTWFAEMSVYTRPEGDGVLGALGAYKDWTPFLYTYTALSTGTNTVYLPQVRIDQDFNIKFGPEKKFVWVIGGTYIKYHTDQAEYILSTGLTVYLDKWVAEYRLFRNLSSPGWIESFSQLFSLAYGQEGWQWTTAICSYGKQAYFATELATPQAVEDNSLLLALRHRHWLAKNYGVFGEISYFDLQGSYQKGGLLLGVFREF